MAYTVKKLAQLSGVSVRTLHFYDEIGLLKPAYYGDNGYRYYQEEQLLLLQQILFFRELGFELSEVQKMMTSSGFDKVRTLEMHRQTLLMDVQRTHELVKTIDKTIAHLKGETVMKPKDMYQGFDPEKQQEYEEYWIKQGQESAELVYESRRRTKGFTKADYERVQAEVAKLHQDMAELIDKKLAPTAKEVQALVKRHFDWINNFYTPTKAIYIGLGQMYINHPDFRKVYDAVHPQLAEFLAEAMKVFADRELT